jgi:hypothetical protein
MMNQTRSSNIWLHQFREPDTSYTAQEKFFNGCTNQQGLTFGSTNQEMLTLAAPISRG